MVANFFPHKGNTSVVLVSLSLRLMNFSHVYGGYACDIIIKPGSYAEMPTECGSGKNLLFGLDSPYIQTEKPILFILNFIQ